MIRGAKKSQISQKNRDYVTCGMSWQLSGMVIAAYRIAH